MGKQCVERPSQRRVATCSVKSSVGDASCSSVRPFSTALTIRASPPGDGEPSRSSSGSSIAAFVAVHSSAAVASCGSREAARNTS
jgi:hypothetical protein